MYDARRRLCMSIIIRKTGNREYVYVAHRDVARMVQPYIGALCEELIGEGLVWFEQVDVQEDPVYVGTPVVWDHIRDFFQSSLRQFVFDLDAERQTVEGRLPTD
jgi:hypothetical protein